MSGADLANLVNEAAILCAEDEFPEDNLIRAGSRPR